MVGGGGESQKTPQAAPPKLGEAAAAAAAAKSPAVAAAKSAEASAGIIIISSSSSEQAAAHYSSGRCAIPVLGLGSPTVHSHFRCPGSFLKPWSPSLGQFDGAGALLTTPHPYYLAVTSCHTTACKSAGNNAHTTRTPYTNVTIMGGRARCACV